MSDYIRCMRGYAHSSLEERDKCDQALAQSDYVLKQEAIERAKRELLRDEPLRDHRGELEALAEHSTLSARVDRITAKLRQSLDYELREALAQERQRRRKAEERVKELEYALGALHSTIARDEFKRPEQLR